MSTPEFGVDRKSKAPWVSLIVIIVVMFVWAGVQATNSTKGPEPLQPVARVKLDVLEYHVTGTAKTASVTYKTGTGTQQNTVDVPMKNQGGGVGVTMKGSAIPSFKYISAQNEDSYGSITCQIILNGVTISENTSSGAYVIASCRA